MRVLLWAGGLFVIVAVLATLPRYDAPPSSPPLVVTHGPILGRPGPTQMGVWVRTEQPTAFQLRYGLEPDYLPFTSATVATQLDHDNTGWVLLSNLKPDTHYYYCVVAPDRPQASAAQGSFRTWPDAAAYRHSVYNPRGLFNVRFESGSCANQGPHSIGPSLPAYGNMVKHLSERVHFGIMNGDFIYEEGREKTPRQWLDSMPHQTTPPLVELLPSLPGVWENYKIYLQRGKNLAAWHRAVPSFFTFDDHEILNDVYACGEAGHRARRTVFRDIGVQGWYDYVGWSNPVEFTQGIHFGRGTATARQDVLTDPRADFRQLDRAQMANLHIHWNTPDAGVNEDRLDRSGGDPNAGVYEVVDVLDAHRLRIRPTPPQTGPVVYSIGRRSYYRWKISNCEFFALDTRTHRQKHDFANPTRPGLSMLGREQREWLIQGMKSSDADFLFVVSSVPFAIPHVGAGGMAAAADDKDDAWTAFLWERDLLVKEWEALNKPVFVLTGDLHNSFVVKVGERVWEMCCGPHNSRNHPLGSEGNRAANGPFVWKDRKVDIRWSTFTLDDVPLEMRTSPVYTLVQVNNVRDVPLKRGESRWVAYPRPQVVFQFFDGWRGELLYAEAIGAR